MKHRRLTIIVLILLLVASASLSQYFPKTATAQTTPDVYVGVDLAYGGTFEDAKALIDQVSNYTNIFVIGVTGITQNTAKLNQTCQYLYDQGLYFIIYREWSTLNSAGWVDYAKQMWGDHFIGFYYQDELGGKQLDSFDPHEKQVTVANNVSDATNQFISMLNFSLSRFEGFYNSSIDIPLYTSDYALYWFDYKAGYDGLFAEFGWNYSRQLNVAMCRGAATIQNKEWGAIITYTYTTPPYIESGQQLYEDMILAYDSGAKYIIVFDTDSNYRYGILQEEHLQALEKFWEYIQLNPRNSNPINTRTAFVLPYGYASGFRGPNDNIWGLWNLEDFSYNVSVSVNSLLEQYGDKLDIIYDDGLLPNESYGYSQIIYWNDTALLPSPSPTISPSPLPTASPSPSPSPTPTLSPTATPTASPTPSPTLSPTPSSTQQPTPTQDLQDEAIELSSFAYPLVTALVLVVALAAVLLVKKKRSD